MKNYNTIATSFLPAFILGLAIILWPQSGLSQETTTSDANDANAVDEVQPPVVDEQPMVEQNTWAQYQIILQRNIFSRQRGPVRQRRAIRPQRTVVRNPESYHMLRGVIQENDTFIAFIENTQSNTVLKLQEGANVARGTVKNFTLDSIEYQLDDKTITVLLGRDLEGGQGTISMSTLLQMSAASSTSSTTSDPNAPATETPLSGDDAEILKRLMEQRKQQLGQ